MSMTKIVLISCAWFLAGIGMGKTMTDNKYRTQFNNIETELNVLENAVDSLKACGIDTLIINPVAKVNALITAYTPDSISCYPFDDGLTATGKDATLPGVAVDPNRIPYGSIVIIDGSPYEADDTGISMRRSAELHIDLRMNDRQAALIHGVQEKEVSIIFKDHLE